jgi:hypothetical protein
MTEEMSVSKTSRISDMAQYTRRNLGTSCGKNVKCHNDHNTTVLMAGTEMVSETSMVFNE